LRKTFSQKAARAQDLATLGSVKELYGVSPGFRRLVASVVAVLGAATLAFLLSLLRQPIGFLALPLAMTALQFTLAPTMRALGFYVYYSPMLKVTLRTATRWELHGGTLFDYVMTLRWSERGVSAARRVMVLYLEGLLEIARGVESGRVPWAVEIAGASYFFNETTARCLGFELQPASWRLRLNLAANFLDLFLQYSFTRGRFAIPKIWDIRQAVVRAGDLSARRSSIETALATLRRRRVPKPPAVAACA
jgi:hypothetical protein